ncbi:MAG: HAMP domain-containing sensor histidine kinase [Bacilli bacterium]
MSKFFMGLTAMALVSNVMITIMYFKKDRIKSVENKIYSYLLKSNLIALILELGCHMAVRIINNKNAFNFTINMSILKLYVVFILLWLLIFNLYVFISTFKNKNNMENELDEYFQKICYPTLLVYMVLAVFIMILPLEIVWLNENSVYTDGFAITYILIPCGFILSTIWFIKIIKNFKRLTPQKYIPIILCLILLITAATLQSYVNRSYTIIVLFQAIITMVMYYTIENPDIEVIKQLNILRDQAELSNNTKTAFLKQMRHEFNTPATQVQYYNDFIREKAKEIKDNSKLKREEINLKSEEILSDTNFIESGIKDIKALVSNAVLIADLENKNFTLEEHVYKTNDLTERINHVVSNNYSSGKEKIRFKFNVSKNMPPVLIGDYQMIESIILNLLSNAYKSTYKGIINLDVVATINNLVCDIIISVKDTGIGIKKENMPKLFNKFERIEFEKNQNDKRGAGLGLSIVKQLANLLGGDVTAQSEYGKGSTFTVNIKQKIVKGELVNDR